MGLAEDFAAAAEAVNKFTSKPTDEELLKIYALYKQGTVGDVNTARPGMFDLKGKYKWDAWDALKGKSQETAQTEYVAFVNELKGKYA